MREFMESRGYEEPVPERWQDPEEQYVFCDDAPFSEIADFVEQFRDGEYVIQQFDWSIYKVECEDE